MPRPTVLRSLLLALPAALLFACSSEPPDTHPDKPVTQRRDAFKAMLRSTEPMSTMLKDRRFDADRFASLADQLAAARETPWKHFGADTNYPPTKARPTVWEKPDEFERRRSEFISATDRLLAAAAARSETRPAARWPPCRTAARPATTTSGADREPSGRAEKLPGRCIPPQASVLERRLRACRRSYMSLRGSEPMEVRRRL